MPIHKPSFDRMTSPLVLPWRSQLESIVKMAEDVGSTHTEVALKYRIPEDTGEDNEYVPEIILRVRTITSCE